MKRALVSMLVMSMITLVGCSGTTTDNNAGTDSGISTENTTGQDNGASTGGSLANMEVKTGDEALERLKKGNEQYVNGSIENVDVSSERRQQLENGQNPFAVILSCSDSRVVTSRIFNTGLGDIFDIKIAGNVVDDLAMGSIEYGVEHLGAPLLVVMGHESCGAVTAAYDNVNKGTEAEGNIEAIVEKIAPAVNGAASIEDASHKNVKDVIAELNQDEIIKHLVDSGKLKVVGAYYDLDGNVEFLD